MKDISGDLMLYGLAGCVFVFGLVLGLDLGGALK
jgi:hypothetical protein